MTGSDKSPQRPAVLKQMVFSLCGPSALALAAHALTAQSLVGILPGQAGTVVVRPKLGKEPGVAEEEIAPA
jgi:hypothetical protein